MKIAMISVFQMELPLAQAYWLSGGRLRFDQLDGTFVKVETDDGLVGWGEGTPWGHTYLPAHGRGLRAALDLLAPAVLGRDPRSLDHLNRVMDLALPGHLYAKSPLDIACWDILGQSADLPIWQLLGGDSQTPVHINSSISTGTPDEMVSLIEKARSDGYRTHSAKIGGDDPAADIARIEAIDAALLPHEYVTYDVNRSWKPGTAVQVLNSVSNAAWVEQPCETMEECAQVARQVRQPVLLDECLHSFGDHLRAWRMGSFGGLKIKPNRVGGLTKARRVRDLALDIGWRMHIEDVGGTALADAAAIHLAASTPAEAHMDSWLAHHHLAVDPVPGQGPRNDAGAVIPSALPGLGVIPEEGAFGEPVAVYE